jgi:phospholipid/cholesterol/gamma-HCH transport system ATP-binding protein
MRPQKSVIEIDSATIVDDQTGNIIVSGVTLYLNFGELALIHLGQRDVCSVIGDACAGLTTPVAGSICFLGHNWPQTSPDHANALRGLIGRVFKTANWIDYMAVSEAILLSQLHHTRRPAEEIRDEAMKLCRIFGLPGLPTQRPGNMLSIDLQKIACARAFLGRPRLIILEEPTQSLGREILPGLTKKINELRDRGAGVLWMTQDDYILREPYLDCTYRFRIVGSELIEATA